DGGRARPRVARRRAGARRTRARAPAGARTRVSARRRRRRDRQCGRNGQGAVIHLGPSDRDHGPRRSRGALRLERAAATVLAGVAGILIALAFGTTPLLVVGLALLVLGATAISWTGLTVRGVSVRRHLYGERVVEGEP